MHHKLLELASMKSLLVSALCVSACTADVAGEERSATVDQALCTVVNDLNKVFVSLALAEASEIKTWFPTRDFKVVYDPNLGYNKVWLSAVAESVCATTGNCPSTRAMLSMQDERLWGTMPKTITFNPTTFRAELIARLQRQKDHETDLLANNPAKLPSSFTLSVYGYPYLLAGCSSLHPYWSKDSSGIALTTTEARKIYERINHFYGLNLRHQGIPEFLSNGAIVGIEYMDRSTQVVTVTNGIVKDPLLAGLGLACAGTGFAGQPVTGTLQPMPGQPLNLYCTP